MLSRFPKARAMPQVKKEPEVFYHPLLYNKACNRDDFSHPALRDLVRDIFLHDHLRFGDVFPYTRADRHLWLTGMIARTFIDHGILGPRAQVLGVSAGNCPLIFWLSTHVGRVYATDLYLEPGSRAATLYGSMPTEPMRHWPGSWNPRRVVIQHMSPLWLQYPDASFDGIFALHALEPWAMAAEVQQALEEIYRVLRPGGLVSLAVEFQTDGTVLPVGSPGRRLFCEEELRDRVMAALPWTPVDAVDLGLSEASRQAEQHEDEAEEDVQRCLAQHGQLLWHELERRRYPFVAVRDGDRLSTVVHLALRKPG